ncbi:MAG: amidohydrolase family protein [Chloroflexi bacterium]|nr:amidohydrolase family protein [Chloroflexota bacterium]
MVVVEGDRIREVGKPEAVKIPPDAAQIDCTQDTVMPGMIDTHTHVTANNKFRVSLDEHYTLDLTTAIVRGTMSLREDLASGVTTMRGLGDRTDVELRFRDVIARGEIPGPRLIISINALRPSHGTASWLAETADGVEEIQRRIRRNFSLGANCVKVFATNVQNGEGYLDYLRGDLTGVPAYSKEELAAAAQQAHSLGMKVAAHAIGGPAMRWAMEVGIDSVEHANLLEEQDLEYFEKYGTFLSDPNLQLFFDDETGFETFDTWKFDWWRAKVFKSREQTAKYMPELIKRGGKICLATDSTHANLWREAKHLRALGVSAQDTLLAVTRNNAILLGLDDQIGTLEPGKLADIISIQGDPLNDMASLRNVGLVMKAGQRYEHLVPSA